MGLYSCSVKKFIPEGQRLYTGATIEIEADSSITEVDELKERLQTVLRPEPNSKFLGMQPGLYFYYKAQRKKPGFINRFLNKKIGEEPVYQIDVAPLEVEDVLLNRLENSGFFYSASSSSFTEDSLEASLTYRLKVPKPYKMANFKLDSMPSPIYKDVQELTANTPLRETNRFSLNNMKLERERIEQGLKSRGYYNFNPDFFIFEADTNQYNNKQFDLFMKLKAEVPKKSLVPYQIKQINVYPNYDLNDSTQIEVNRFKSKNFYQDTLFFKPKYLNKYITLEEGQYFNPKTSKNTARRLSTIGAYKFVNVQYKEIDSSMTDSLGALEANIYLSPLTKRALRAELQAVTKSNGFTGPNLALTYSNRNLFQGGETMNISTTVGYETQIASGDNRGLSSLELGLKGELIFPRVISPFNIGDDFFEYSIPKTKTSLGLKYLNRSQLYTLLSGSALFGYLWDANKYVTYELNPISINYTSLSNTTPEFQTILDENPFLQRSFDQQFISGLTLSFTYNGMVDANDPNQFYVNSTLDVAGNSISLLGKENSETGVKEFLGLEYAQYAKADVDLRFHLNFGKDRQQTLATRLFAGYGLPYGNSDVVPFVKQYFSGGPYSVRAFRNRSLGPGVYNEDNDTGNNGGFFDRTGNIRLEANIEYRFPIVSFFKGAVFADAGNVWNSEPNPAFNGLDEFSSNFINELGMGVGFGLRVDVQGFVIRFDLAAPFHDPSLPKGERYDFQYDQPVFNFAIGYPF
ncbi:BamA/TamA family outer membrane protein [Subsaximicrobium wynnwilliamsii]|uniref:BamA/TamA family outer membrane protein n=1 Tax=Subsaximicrobium wynnwilliamsii TaxID=291179 RepID=A0A5C6ZJR0_9FLAO|nr:BamA/TamA family outer membrane protein [Subsaximicrobium wynnwilliamsii]TXD83557.1 BamA/TamA family outer membrane protein [Subsaximicrobium wynnwilliamsii]TXD89302.1 BamA/TamA family outer membrane protein [Subsaximicrobium wynnwilliamsii]TXE03236.1 BamA/TamA family outer membrane protein [Subsaximicrobium wynnwilliamsii]